ncbi:TetR/AcrR family transcriptional regulator [Nocardia cyriacigeorgica]|uniref:TetR/AcrR family transcriptional regulator n=1 Tax=Nocardia cyriacigeorgica TaxID=135487 RepID=UPI001E2AB722|nr:TetR/AcrR family transcriptional regulator [Nocardia cyriacigeorgica]
MTPTTKRSDATRQALLRAARDEFAEYGLAGARVDRIAEAAGVNKERIYGLFGSKDKLFDVILIDSLREFMETVQPLADTEVGDYVAKLFDYHHDNPKLLRLMLWEALHRGADAHDIDGWRADFYERKFDRAQQQFGVDQQRAGLLLIALCGVANWANTLPQTARLLLGDAADDTATIRTFMADFARAALRFDPDSPVNILTGPGAAGGEQAQNDAARGVHPQADLESTGTTSGSGVPTRLVTSTDGSGTDPVDAAAARLRAAQAAAEAARAELATALRDAHACGTSANQLARQVSGTLSRPVVLKLLAD